MGLTAGTRLGPYEITASLGAGGMGEVYRARDARLGRDVALKVLPADVACDADRRARFEREARAVAALSHPNILALFDIGTAADTLFVVTELLDGETLADRLRQGALPVRKAVEIAVSVARGLSATHGKGIAHRDLKPANIFLLADGQVKILDFGLAKLQDPKTPRPQDPSASPTIASPEPTARGVILGTAGYMAPEQIRGQPVDGRADLFALGVVLYEMLTGARAFARETTAETLTAILKEDPPDLTTARADLPPALDRIVRHALEKNPAERFQSARDVIFALEALSGTGQAAPLDRPHATSARRAASPTGTGRLAVPAILVALALAAGAWAGIRWASPPEREWPTEWVGEDLGGPPIAFQPRISPSGQDLAFQAMVNNQVQVALMKPGTGSWQVLTNDRTPGGANGLSWSRDGTRVLFHRMVERPRGIYSVTVPAGDENVVFKEGGLPRELPDGGYLVTRVNEGREHQLHRARRDAQQAEPLDAVLAKQGGDAYALFPDAKEVAYLGRPQSEPGAADHLFVLDLATNRSRRLVPELRLEAGRWLDFPMAVTQTSVVFALRAGDTHRIVAAPRDGTAGVQTLFALTDGPANLDVGPDRAIYLDLRSARWWLLRTTPGGASPEMIELPLIERQLLPLPDGRVLVPQIVGGRRHVMAAARDGGRRPFVPTLADESKYPMAMVGPDRVALIAGTATEWHITLVAIADGLVAGRIPAVDGATVTALAGSPDGRTLYYVSDGVVWSVPVEGGTPARVRDGNGVAVDPLGRYLVINLFEPDVVRLFRVPLDGSPEAEIPIADGVRLARDPLAPNAVARDGRIALRVAQSWYWPAAIVDPTTGQVEPLIRNASMDHIKPGWTVDGQIVAGAWESPSRLWRFRPAPP